jgi:hypothetical protein
MDVFRPAFHMIKLTYLYNCSSLTTRERLAGALSTSELRYQTIPHTQAALCVCACDVLCG